MVDSLVECCAELRHASDSREVIAVAMRTLERVTILIPLVEASTELWLAISNTRAAATEIYNKRSTPAECLSAVAQLSWGLERIRLLWDSHPKSREGRAEIAAATKAKATAAHHTEELEAVQYCYGQARRELGRGAKQAALDRRCRELLDSTAPMGLAKLRKLKAELGLSATRNGATIPRS